jgi:acid phosphatase family membrane protein YuiD
VSAVGETGAAPSSASSLMTVALETPAARVLADQTATIADLQFVMDCCKRLLAELARPEDDRDLIVALALWSAALAAYARCFTEGKRLGLSSEDVRGLPLHGAVMKFHTWVLAERYKLTAHPADPFQAARVGAALGQQHDEDTVAGIAILSASRVLVDDIGVRQLGGLASELAKQVADRAREQQDVVLAEAQQLSGAALARLPPLRPGPPRLGDAAG